MSDEKKKVAPQYVKSAVVPATEDVRCPACGEGIVRVEVGPLPRYRICDSPYCGQHWVAGEGDPPELFPVVRLPGAIMPAERDEIVRAGQPYRCKWHTARKDLVPCPLCGAGMDPIDYHPPGEAIVVPGWVCPKCGDIFRDAELQRLC